MKLHRRTRAGLRVAFVVIALGALIVALVHSWGEVSRSLHRMGPAAVAGALALAVAGLFGTCMCWRSLLSELGTPLRVPACLRVFFLAQIGKYLPGSVWPMVAQMEMSRDLGIARRRSGTAYLLFWVLNPLTGLIVAAATLPFASPDAARHYVWFVLAVPVGLAALHPAVLNPAVDRLFRLLRRPPLEHRLSLAGLARSAAWLALTWLCYGLSVLVLAGPLGVHGGRALPAAVGAYALAWSAGFLFVIAPAGLGVRDAALVLTLTPVMSVPAATAVAAVSRVVQTLGDGVWAGVAAILHGHGRLRRPGPGPEPASSGPERGSPPGSGPDVASAPGGTDGEPAAREP